MGRKVKLKNGRDAMKQKSKDAEILTSTQHRISKKREMVLRYCHVWRAGEEVLMTYKLNPQLRLIKAPVILVVEGQESCYGSGDELTALTFAKNYIIDSIRTRENKIVVELKENDRQFNINWIGEEEVSFM